VTDPDSRSSIPHARLRFGAAPVEPVPTAGLRVVLDLRPLQEPDRGPVTAAYLEELLAAYAAEPLAGESFTFVLQAGLADPSEAVEAIDQLDVAGRRWLPPTHLLRSGALTVDPFLLRAASLGTRWRARSRGAAGAVYHAAGGAVPIASGLPLVVSLLDVAPWELPMAYQGTPTARFGQRLRARILQTATAVIVPSRAAAVAARRLLHIRRDRLSVVPLAARQAFTATGRHPDPVAAAAAAEELRLRGVPDRFFLYAGRYDARQDLTTLLRALRIVGAETPPRRRPSVPWPPHVLLVGATTDDRAALGRAAAREGVGEMLSYAPRLDLSTLAALASRARAVLVPALSDAAGLGALDALAVGTPVVGTTAGALPEIVGRAGILAEPRDAERLAAALRAAWSDETVHRSLVAAARTAGRGAGTLPRTWEAVARETRAVYARVGASRR
jgi:glycosyltransferase involved in cell wall biosynthesis